jgi:hypothetical protein
MNLRFYIAATLIFFASIVGGVITAVEVAYNMLFPVVANPYLEEALGFVMYAVAAVITGSIIGFAVAIIIIHKLSKRWGSQLNFGSHPVLKITSLSFLTFLVLLFLLLIFYPSK